MTLLNYLVGAIVAYQAVLGLPAPQMKYGENTGAVGGVSPPIATDQAASGNLRGDSSLLGGVASRPPITGGDSAAVPNPQLVEGQEASGDLGLYLNMNSVDVPQPIRGTKGNTDPGPRTYQYEKLNPDLYAPPATDKGDVPNAMWPLGLSHNKLGSGDGAGWARQQNVKQLPVATKMAGVDMRLAPGAYRELHWHRSAEWALVLKGSARVAAVDQDGHAFVDDVMAGDVWFFPSGIPHSIQALGEGTEFLLVFDDGDFSEDSTFLASEVFMRNPISVLSKNLQADASAFKDLPDKELFIFNGTPAPEFSEQTVTSPAGALPSEDAYTYHWSQQQPYTVPGGSVKILDPQTFPIAKGFSAALVVLQPGAMREIHWHATSDEWNYFLQGSARITVFAAPSSSRTFDFTAGDVGYIEMSNSHYVENTGPEDCIFLEVLQADRFTDISVAQWLALTPKQVVKDTLNLTDEVIDRIPKSKTLIKPGNANMTAMAGGGKNFKA